LSVQAYVEEKTSACPCPLKQRTLRRSISTSGKGLFTGVTIELTISPASSGSGIWFKRLDCPNAEPLKASLEAVKSTPRCTILGNEEIQVQTVEHILSALRAFHIDNAIITLSGPEVPIGDGSALPFVEMIKEAGIQELSCRREYFTITEPVFLSQNDIHLVALPAQEFRISYTLHYPFSPLIQSQYYSFALDEEAYEKEIAPSRTFCLYEEIAPLMEKGLVKGGGLDSAVVIAEDRILNPEGLRFANEMVRHKILDLLGDLSLMQTPILAHILAVRSGHSTNVAFARLLSNQVILKKESSR
jgi:UDP-3-O-[3-hydroxymyristoyl] N-acetylglucosamine deacetylase